MMWFAAPWRRSTVPKVRKMRRRAFSATRSQPTGIENGNGPSQDYSGLLRSLGLAQQYKYDGRLQDAEEYYNRTLAALEQSPDPNARVLLPQALDELGNLYHSEGRTLKRRVCSCVRLTCAKKAPG